MPAVPASAIHTNTILAAVRRRAVEGDLASLVAVRRVDGPGRIVPAALKVVRDLRLGQAREEQREEGRREGEEGGRAKHRFLCFGHSRALVLNDFAW